MAILEKEVWVKIHNTTIDYFEKLGYEIPKIKDHQGRLRVKRGTEILVDIEHLSQRSHALITKICDDCGEHVKNKKYCNIIIAREKGNGKDYCRKCSNVNGWKNYKNNMSYEKTFEYYAINNDMGYLLNEFSENNNVKPIEITHSNGIEYKWNCVNGHEWFASTNNRIKGSGCPYCSGFFPTKENNLAIKFPNLAAEWCFELNEKNPNEYTSFSNYKVWWVCLQGHKWVTGINNRSNGTGCPVCNQSKGERKIYEWLINYNFPFISQKEFIGLIGTGGGNLSYDFYLPNQNILIEYQGEQHERAVDFLNEGLNVAERNFIVQQEHDCRKREYAKKSNNKLLEIWYWDFDNVEAILETQLLRRN